MTKEQEGTPQKSDSLTGRGIDANSWLEDISQIEDALYEGVDWEIFRKATTTEAEEQVINNGLQMTNTDLTNLSEISDETVVRRRPQSRVSPRNGR